MCGTRAWRDRGARYPGSASSNHSPTRDRYGLKRGPAAGGAAYAILLPIRTILEASKRHEEDGLIEKDVGTFLRARKQAEGQQRSLLSELLNGQSIQASCQAAMDEPSRSMSPPYSLMTYEAAPVVCAFSSAK
jgi:hypothetical protein